MAVKHFNLIILTGLPGAGKTTYANKNFSDYAEVMYIAYDDYKNEKNEYTPIGKIIKKQGFFHNYNTIVFDGFIPDKEARIAAIYEILNATRKYWKNYCHSRKGDTVYFDVQEYFWEPDKEACLNNDKWRNRPKSSKESINTWASLIEPLTKNDWDNNLGEIFPEDKFIDTKFLYTEAYDYKEGVIEYTKNYLTSNKSNPSILTGYSWNTRYDSPREFIELDNILTKLCPNITFLQYKRLCRECEAKVIIDERYDDYYSNEPSIYNYWEVNIDKVHQWLIDNDLLEV